MRRLVLLAALSGLLPTPAVAPPASLADKPCDDSLREKQHRCEALWKQISGEAAPETAQCGLDQLRHRQEGKLTQEQHLPDNTGFIEHSAERRLELLKEGWTSRETGRTFPARAYRVSVSESSCIFFPADSSSSRLTRIGALKWIARAIASEDRLSNTFVVSFITTVRSA